MYEKDQKWLHDRCVSSKRSSIFICIGWLASINQLVSRSLHVGVGWGLIKRWCSTCINNNSSHWRLHYGLAFIFIELIITLLIKAFSALMSSLESDLVIVVTCDEENPRLDTVLKLLNEQEIHVSEVIHARHNLIIDVLNNTDSNILLYLPCENEVLNYFIDLNKIIDML